jgi:hypothetical protein
MRLQCTTHYSAWHSDQYEIGLSLSFVMNNDNPTNPETSDFVIALNDSDARSCN